jgi:hypothetical protein
MTKSNSAREALTRAVNKAIAGGAPIYENRPANILERPASAEQSTIARSPEGLSEHAMTGAWRVIIARKGEKARTFYFSDNDDARHKDAVRRVAASVLEAL